jgi:Domain of unknown function (DUF4203)
MPENQYIAGAIFSVIGLAVLFFGYKFFKAALGLMGFAAGFVLVVTLGSDLTDFGQTEILIAGLIGGVAFIFLFVLAYYAGIFIMGALLGYILGTSVSPYIHVDPLIIIAVSVVLGGMITFAVQKVVIICISAFFGAWIFLLGIGQLLGHIKTASLINNPGNVLLFYQEFTWMMLVWLAIAMIGIYSQFRRMGKKKE